MAGNVIHETWNVAEGLPLLLVDGTTNYVYGAGGLPLEQVSSSGTLYYHQDQIGSTRALTNSSGSMVASYTYDPYGRLTGSTGSSSNPFGYAGQYADVESGLNYLRARYYDPATGQFLTRDPIEASTASTYGYGDQNPLNKSDPRGLAPDPCIDSCAMPTLPSQLLIRPDEYPNAVLIFNYSVWAGVSRAHARELVAVAYMESGLNAGQVNGIGASGLFQLLSQDYIDAANKLGGVLDPSSNLQAILPDYVKYWNSNPTAQPGAAGAAVERSGEPASFYAEPLSWLPVYYPLVVTC